MTTGRPTSGCSQKTRATVDDLADGQDMAGAELGDLRDLVSPSLTVHPVFLFGELVSYQNGKKYCARSLIKPSNP